ncbi:MAG: ATP synthase F0 subunit B, partial [Lachnospiraceae bacterium]|nr:ATP synthase F0 subunit B [Lachnospiraceae bacterium]
MLRLDWNILFNIINILILYFLLKRFLFKPVNGILEKRQQEADSIFAQANEKEAQAQESKAQYET